ncbi:hypothetical protein GCM10010313_75800 [Streptomyces violarus]|uniref:DUF3592 domain-containing protein n=1 Tax=Streptomyces violarus TaxID=67380 RepID=A0A7W4ZQC5_9ACTN|nr:MULTISPECIES: DUF3592 domain-containing protein [Streptomyces]MBB3076551.1 hypothetical protein [Streptomyces violarus]WRT99346.1 DUF3592 domain-containing protein [Streptomyces sp. CGMCC 4.1772]GHD31880.1 hypothetical protein GCM10010313_75800 [Streptomyces violarus]
MAKKKSKRHTDQYQLPPHVEEARRAVARAAAWKPRPPLPQLRVILVGFGLFLLCVGMALAFLLPPHSLVQDLRSRGVSAAATVVGVDSKPKYVKVRLVSSPKAGTEVKLWDYAGMLPETQTGASMIVMYDPKDPSRILAQSWVEDPPANLPAYGTSALAIICLGLATAVTWRRIWILRTFGPEEPPASSAGGNKPRDKGVRRTKS